MSYPSYWCCFYKTSNLKHEKRPYVWLKGQSLPHSSSPLNSTAIRSAKLRIAKVKRAEDFALCIEMFLPVSGLYQPFLSNQKACFMNYSSLGHKWDRPGRGSNKLGRGESKYRKEQGPTSRLYDWPFNVWVVPTASQKDEILDKTFVDLQILLSNTARPTLSNQCVYL